ncbi:dihydroxyacetone kinase subunit L [Actinomycetospora sp. NBRC 106375]|uniref:dihydroxyacetone kinase subunit DhaL n=1 Tax=Actinomycetospora sp. NBRC 106375 TaxID=3032207 RepID=UPI0024A20319|nr:dihydroxyacetone kinase subunit DhaL [Actinomycetospora sp. NBRC 106375]GLZ48393.1 dihydroxyacetone kinase subunit L [Actinomycetospora sp. NBRC 106375]
MAGVDVETLQRWLRGFAASVAEQRDALTALDAAIGDADHGANMHRGMTAVTEAVTATPPADPTALLKQTATVLIRSVGGASGPLYGTLFLRMASATGGETVLEPATFAKALRAGLEGVISRGKAELGDKTMVDALAPALDALDASLAEGGSLATALHAASEAADAGRDATTPMIARKGRASYLGDRSAGHQDPGATSAALLVAAAAAAVSGDG